MAQASLMESSRLLRLLLNGDMGDSGTDLGSNPSLHNWSRSVSELEYAESLIKECPLVTVGHPDRQLSSRLNSAWKMVLVYTQVCAIGSLGYRICAQDRKQPLNRSDRIVLDQGAAQRRPSKDRAW